MMLLVIPYENNVDIITICDMKCLNRKPIVSELKKNKKIKKGLHMMSVIGNKKEFGIDFTE